MMRIEESLQTIRDFQKVAPVEVIGLANSLGVKVYYTDWPSDVSGRIQKDAKLGGASGYAILVNKNHHENRRRFTVAHEIAHFVLHRHEIGDGVFDDALYRSGLSQKIEIEANKLAADILMPWPLINEAFGKGINTIDALAARFAVSKSAMSIRLGVPYEP
jgi:Zn-dependent peptidase ImmA (M78 family)